MDGEHLAEREETLNGDLIDAAKNGDLKKVESILQAEGNVVFAADDQSPQKPSSALKNKALRKAARYGHAEVVKVLLRAGAKMEDKNSKAFQRAVQYNQIEVVKLLVEAGEDIHRYEDYALRVAAGNGNVQTVLFLLQAGADLHACEDQAFRHAVIYCQEETVRVLLRAGADVHAKKDKLFDSTGFFIGNKEIIRMLLQAGGCSHHFKGCEVERILSPDFILRSNGNVISEIEKSHPELGEKYQSSQNKRVLKSIEDENNFEARIALFDLYYRPGEPAYYQAAGFHF